MDVSESDWITKALNNIDKYLHRGGKCKGDEPQFIGGTDLLNTIGMALGLQICNPKDWTKNELQKACNGKLVYFVGEARKAIDTIADQIKHCCSEDGPVDVTVLPIELYYKGKLYELPLFRVKRDEQSENYYVDNIGRYYTSYIDWYERNKLPPGEIAYPSKLKLGYKYSHVSFTVTPSMRTDAKALDAAAAVIGTGSGIYSSSHSAASLAVAGIGDTVRGTTISEYHLPDKATYGESVNSIPNDESGSWLDISSNIGSYRAMGASIRLTSLTVHNREISNAYRMFVNIANGTNMIMSTIAMLDTTFYFVNQQEDLSSIENLIYAVLVAFWTKGHFKYRTARTMIREAENFAFMYISDGLDVAQIKELNALRNRFGNDAQLLREFYKAVESNISLCNFIQFFIDAKRQGQLKFEGLGNLILPGGYSCSVELLNQIPKNVRPHMFDIETNLTLEEIRLFKRLHQSMNNDMNFIIGIATFGEYYDLTVHKAVKNIIHFWKTYSYINCTSGPDIKIANDTLVLGMAPPIPIVQLPHLSPQMIRFVSHLSRLDASASQPWSVAVPVLLKLQSWGMFTNCRVTNTKHSGFAVLVLNNQLQVSIYTLNSMPKEVCQQIFILVGNLPSNFNTKSILPKELSMLCLKNRLRLQYHRKENVIWFNNNVGLCNKVAMSELLRSRFLNHELDRLYQFRDIVMNRRAEMYMSDIMTFIAKSNPINIHEMVTYGEFATKYGEIIKGQVERKIKDGILKLPPYTDKKEWLRAIIRQEVFGYNGSMKPKLNELLNIVTNNDMVGTLNVRKDLSDTVLVTTVRQKRIRFASRVSAAYHVLKHETNPIEAYVAQANEAIRSAGDRYSVNLTQDGDAKNIRFESENGSCIILEKDGRVVLCTFTPL